MGFRVNVLPAALKDVQDAVDYYDEQQLGLGERFEAELNDFLLSLEKNPFFQYRYDVIRCLPLKRFPFMVHFTVNENKQEVVVHAVFHTSLNPKHWKAER